MIVKVNFNLGQECNCNFIQNTCTNQNLEIFPCPKSNQNEYISVLFIFQYAGWLKERSICGKSAYFFEVVSIKQKYFIYLLLYCCVVLDPID